MKLTRPRPVIPNPKKNRNGRQMMRSEGTIESKWAWFRRPKDKPSDAGRHRRGDGLLKTYRPRLLAH